MALTLHEVIADAAHRLTSASIPPSDARLDAEVLARHVLGWDRAALLVHGRDEASPEFVGRFQTLIERRAAREPVALITGRREFWDRDFEVTRDVLIPRPETELIIETVLEEHDRAGTLRILDAGTGSGCLAVTLAAELPLAHVVATDISEPALAVARRNAARHGVLGRLTFVQASLYESLSGRFDVIVSNPPYVPSCEELAPEVRLFEPAQALFAGLDGLEVLRRLIPGARGLVAPDGLFVVEFGFGQSDAVREIARSADWPRVEMRSDIQGIPRVCIMSSF